MILFLTIENGYASEIRCKSTASKCHYMSQVKKKCKKNAFFLNLVQKKPVPLAFPCIGIRFYRSLCTHN